MYVLGIDGGGTKIEFMVANLNGNEVIRFEFQENTNLKYTTSQKMVQILDKGLIQIKQKIPLNDIKYAYLGIAECGEGCVGKGRKEILEFLKRNFTNFELADDQYSVFRAKSDDKNGVLANAGTGSNINHFFNGLEKNYKSVGIGGRDLGNLFVNEMKFGGIKSNSEIFRATEVFLKQNPVEFFDSLKPLEIMLHPDIPRLPRHLILASIHDSILEQELDSYCIMIASRWSLKLISYCNINFGYKPTDTFNIALTGSLWRWDKMRKMTISTLKSTFPKVNIIYDIEQKPVMGAVKIALERVKTTVNNL